MRAGMPAAWLEWIYNWKADSGRRTLKSRRRGVKLEGAFSEPVSALKEARLPRAHRASGISSRRGMFDL